MALTIEHNEESSALIRKPWQQARELIPLRGIDIGPLDVTLHSRADGSMLVSPVEALGHYPEKLTARLEHWAQLTPERTFLAQRTANGAWRVISYATALDQVRAIGQAILARRASPERPVAILSGNDIEHALLGLAAMYVGVPYAPISPAYSLVSTDFAKLRHVMEILTPSLVFACSGSKFGRALRVAVPPGADIVVTDEAPAGLPATRFEDLVTTRITDAVDWAHAAVRRDTLAKILFTSGSTGHPKGVINTQQMLCSNQEMIAHVFRFCRREPPVLVDWLPWHHTFGGNHNFNLVLYNGGSLYIDEGSPSPSGIGPTLSNLREIAPTVYFNVPKGYEALIPHLHDDPILLARFFSRLKMMFYAAAGLAQHVWDELQALSVRARGERIPMLTGLGSTETAPFALVSGADVPGPGIIGVPAPGNVAKLVPCGDKLELRIKGVNVTPGYFRQPELTRKAFDAEGFYCSGDALRFVDLNDPQRGFAFDGRIAEDFKLSTGTWVSVGSLRTELIGRLAPLASDVVIAGHDRDDIRALIFPNVGACREACGDAGVDDSPAELLRRPQLRARFESLLNALAAKNTGSSRRIVAAILVEDPASLDTGEMTDKGSLNQRAVLHHRAVLVDELYAVEPSVRVIRVAAAPTTGVTNVASAHAAPTAPSTT
jgi:feruloyl-CoA synthase